MASNETLVNAMNAIRSISTPTYQERIPQATKENISNIANPLLQYTPVMNEFLHNLMNKIGLTLIRNRTYNNPLSVLKQGSIPLGQDIEEIFTNPANAETYNPRSTDLLKQTPPDSKVIYHRMNRQDKYTVSISKPRLTQAFMSWDNLDNFINSITQSLYSGNYIDEFNLCKHILADSVHQNKCKKVNVSLIDSANNAMKFITQARKTFTDFGFPSNDNNQYSVMNPNDKIITWTPPEDIRFVLRNDIEAFVDVNVLANAFNMNKAQFLGQTLIVNDFEDTNCIAMMFDKSYTQIYDNHTELTEFFNADTLTWNYYYHIWQTYSLSTFCNCVAFMEV